MNTIKLKDILSISGKGGLFKYIAQARNGIVVESIEDNKRHVAAATARVSSLEDIAIFTHDAEVPLGDIFFMIHEKSEGKETLSHKSPVNELKSYFEELVPDFDEERVYVSDIKKVFQWYNQLLVHDLLEVVEKEEEASTETTTEEPKEESAEEPTKDSADSESK
ncbi:MAG: DUF5606 domain-containing protein [Bacteroidota bacterium]